MKKLCFIFVIVVMLFSGCNNNIRDVELTDFEYTYQNDNKRLKIVANCNIADLELEYHLKDGYIITETGKLECGSLKEDRIYYFAIINEMEREFNDLEIISEKGKVDKAISTTERNARLDDIDFDNTVIEENNVLYFVITPHENITDFKMTYQARKDMTVYSQWEFTNCFEKVIAETEYRIEIPSFTQEITSVTNLSATGKVKI